MTPSPDPIDELRASRPAAPPELRARVREIAGEAAPRQPARRLLRLPARRAALVALPAAALLALASAGAIGLSRSGSPEAFEREATTLPGAERADAGAAVAPADETQTTRLGGQRSPGGIAPSPDRAQRVSASLTLEVADADAVSRAAQRALELTRALGGHVVSASVATGDEGSATLTVRVPVAKVQEAIVELSALGRIAAQQVTIDDLQEPLDALERRERSLRTQIARITARLATARLDPETRALLEARRASLRDELRSVRRGISATAAEARLATIQVSVLTPDALGAVPVPSRLERALDEALNVLVWEGVVALAIAIVVAPFALLALAAWLAQRVYRRREEERLLAS